MVKIVPFVLFVVGASSLDIRVGTWKDMKICWRRVQKELYPVTWCIAMHHSTYVYRREELKYIVGGIKINWSMSWGEA